MIGFMQAVLEDESVLRERIENQRLNLQIAFADFRI